MAHPPDETAPANPLARQLRLFKGLALVLFVSAAGLGGAFLYVRHQGQPVEIYLGKHSVGVVQNSAVADRLLMAAERSKVSRQYDANKLIRREPVQLKPAPPGAVLLPEDEVKKKIAAALHVKARAFVILVQGKPSVGLPTSAAAFSTLTQVKDHFAQLPPDVPLIGDPTFRQKITVKPMAIDSSMTRGTAAEAAAYLWTPQVFRSQKYTVKRGDTGLKIAVQYHLTLTQFIAINPGRDINRLKVGDEVNMAKTPVLIVVLVTKKYTRIEKILAYAPEEQAGRRSVTYRVTYANGQEMHKDVLNLATLEKPQPRMQL